MDQITMYMSDDQLRSLLPEFEKNEAILVTELDRLRSNIRAIKTRIGELTKTVQVNSFSRYGKKYDVSRTGTNPVFDYKCTCEAFRFKNGLDWLGYCKHIQYAKNLNLFR